MLIMHIFFFLMKLPEGIPTSESWSRQSTLLVFSSQLIISMKGRRLQMNMCKGQKLISSQLQDTLRMFSFCTLFRTAGLICPTLHRQTHCLGTNSINESLRGEISSRAVSLKRKVQNHHKSWTENVESSLLSLRWQFCRVIPNVQTNPLDVFASDKPLWWEASKTLPVPWN